MDKKNIKEQLYKLIDDIDDEETLNILKEDIVSYATSSHTDILDELTNEQLIALEQSIKEDDNGASVDYDTSKKAFDEWRTKLKSAGDSNRSGQKHTGI